MQIDGSISRIGVVRALQLGDLLCAVPAWRALRAAFPDAHVTVIGLPWARQFVERFHAYVDDWVEFPGFPPLPEQPCRIDAVPAFVSDLQSRRFELMIQMHGNGRWMNALLPLFGAATNAGFYVEGDYCPDPHRFLPYPDELPEVRRHLRLMEFLGIPLRGEELEWPMTERDRRAFDELEEVRGLLPGEYVCVHPGGRGAARRWLPGRFASVADALARKGWPVVVTGIAEERHLGEAMEQGMTIPPINLIGRTDLGTLGVLLNGARLVLANDTGVSHLAAALRVPSVIIVTGSDPVRWAPLDRWRHRVVPGTTATVPSVMAEIDRLLREIPCQMGVGA